MIYFDGYTIILSIAVNDAKYGRCTYYSGNKINKKFTKTVYCRSDKRYVLRLPQEASKTASNQNSLLCGHHLRLARGDTRRVGGPGRTCRPPGDGRSGRDAFSEPVPYRPGHVPPPAARGQMKTPTAHPMRAAGVL